MAAEIRLFPCLTDNFGYLIHDPASKATASVDAPEAAPIIKALEGEGIAAHVLEEPPGESPNRSHARYRHHLDDFDEAVRHHEMRMALQGLGERFLRLRLQDGVTAEVVGAR